MVSFLEAPYEQMEREGLEGSRSELPALEKWTQEGKRVNEREPVDKVKKLMKTSGLINEIRACTSL